MLINQRDVFNYNFPFPDGSWKIHPVIVLSIPQVVLVEQTFIGIPISHSELYNDNGYSFPLYDSSFEKALIHKESHARMHLITVLRTQEIIGKSVNKMKQEDFNELFSQIQELIFGCQ